MAEDDPRVRAAVVQALGTCGYRVLTASGASEEVALARTSGGALHLLLTDVVLPSHGGHELARLVRERVRAVLYRSPGPPAAAQGGPHATGR